MKRHLFQKILLLTVGFLVLSPFASAEFRYTDVPPESEAMAAIEYLSEKDIFEGYVDGTFGYEKGINRAELMAIVARMEGVEPDLVDYQNCFTDVTTEWFAPYVCYGKFRGWIKGYEDGSFRPAQGVSHPEAIKMILRPLYTKEIFALSSEEKEQWIESKFYHPEVHGNAWYAPYVAFSYKMNLGESLMRPSSQENLDGFKSSRDAVAEFMFKALLTQQNQWPKYDDYLRDKLFLSQNKDYLISQQYPCYKRSQTLPDFLFEHLNQQYGQLILNGRNTSDTSLENLESLPYFSVDDFCLRTDGSYLLYGSSIDEQKIIQRHAIYFDAEGKFIKDNVTSCENTILGLFGELPRTPSSFDPNSFEIIDCIYSKDENYVYGMSDRFENADPKTFQPLDFPYSKDATHVYIEDDMIEGVDAKSFETFPVSISGIEVAFYAVDLNQAYFFGDVIDGADPLTFKAYGLLKMPEQFTIDFQKAFPDIVFELLMNNFAYDKNAWYMAGEKIEGIDVSTFQPLDFFYAKDADHVYRLGELMDEETSIIQGADPASFVGIGASPYGKDAQHVYYKGIILKEADPVTAALIQNPGEIMEFWLKDKNNFYVDGELISDIADVESFEIIDQYFGKDATHVYYLYDRYHSETDTLYFPRVEGADPSTFERVTGWDDYSGLYRDANHLYLNGKRLETKTLDLESLEWVDEYTLKDAQNFTCMLNYDTSSVAYCEQE